MSYSNESITVSGLLHKKRGGFGKMMMNPWQFRFFTLTNTGILSYFDTDINSAIEISDSKARGRLNLRESKIEIFKDITIEGSPTNFTILLCPTFDEKWKLCAATKDDQLRWVTAFGKLGVNAPSRNPSLDVSRDSDLINSQRLFESPEKSASNSVNLNSSESPSSSLSPSVPENIQTKNSTSDSLSTSNSKVSNTIEPSNITKTQETKASVLPGKTSRGRLRVASVNQVGSQDFMESVLVISIVNLCLQLLLSTSLSLFKLIYAMIINIVITITLHLRFNRVTKEVEKSKMDSTIQDDLKKISTIVPIEVTKEALVVSSNQSDMRIDNVGPIVLEPNSRNSKPIAGQTIKQVFTLPMKSPSHTWCKPDYRTFNVRIGPDYNRYKKKAPSAVPLYDTVAVDVFW